MHRPCQCVVDVLWHVVVDVVVVVVPLQLFLVQLFSLGLFKVDAASCSFQCVFVIFFLYFFAFLHIVNASASHTPSVRNDRKKRKTKFYSFQQFFTLLVTTSRKFSFPCVHISKQYAAFLSFLCFSDFFLFLLLQLFVLSKKDKNLPTTFFCCLVLCAYNL